MSDFQLRQPQLGDSLPRPSAPHLLPPEQLQLHLDPALQAAMAPSLLTPNLAMAQFNALSHFTETPAIPSPSLAPPFFSEDGTAGVRGRRGGVDLQAGVTGATGGEFSGTASAQVQVAPGLRLGPQITGSVNGDNGPTIVGGIGGSF
jgi:hypothetical protein